MATLTAGQLIDLAQWVEVATYPQPITFVRKTFNDAFQAIETYAAGMIATAPAQSLVAAVNAAVAADGVTLTQAQVVFLLKIWARYKAG